MTAMRFFELVMEDLQSGRETWRVMVLFSTLATGIAGLYIWW